MLSYEEMTYFTAFDQYGTLTQVAEAYHISQPTITRAMKKAEEVFGVPLFERTKNSIQLNANGKMVADELNRLLVSIDEMIDRVQAFDRANRTIAIGSAAAVQLPELVGKLSRGYPNKAIVTELKMPDELIKGLENHQYQLIVLPYQPKDPDHLYHMKEIGKEDLMFLLPKDHPLANRKSLRLEDLNGENILLFSEIGFWADLVRKHMPDSRFLVQTERYSFQELIINSVLPCFATKLSVTNPEDYEQRVMIPIENEDVHVSYYLVCLQKEYRQFAMLF